MFQLKNKIDFEKTYFYSTILFAFSLPLSRAAISFFTIWFIFLWIVEGDFKRKYEQIKNSQPIKILLFFIFFSSLTFFVSEDKKTALNIIRLFSYLFTSIILYTSLKTQHIDKIISAFLAGMFVSEIVSYGIFFELWNYKNTPPSNPSPFMIHIEYSVFLAFTSILLLNRLFSKHYSMKEKIFFGFFFLTVTSNLFLTHGRTGQVAYIATIFVMSILHFRFNFKSILISFLLLTTIFGSAFYLSKNFQNRVNQTKNELTQIFQKNNLKGSWGIRISFWITTFNILKEHPFGNGIGDYKLALKKEIAKERYDPKIYAKSFISKSHPHNQYLLVLLQTGFIGLMIFIYFLYSIFKLDIKDRELNELKILFITLFTIAFIAEPLLIKQFAANLFSLFFGIFLIATKQKNY